MPFTSKVIFAFLFFSCASLEIPIHKIPIINRLGLQLSGGAASLIIPDVGYQHLEVFLGISRPFKIFGGLVKFGVFIASSINSENGLESEFKLGANDYNSMRDQWDY